MAQLADFARSASIPSTARRLGRTDTVDPELWSSIWTVGGFCWLCVAVIGILWFRPVAGTIQGGEYVVSSSVRLLLHVLLYLLAAPAYRIGLGMGWPTGALHRAGVVVANAILALLFIRVCPLVLLISSHLIDHATDFDYGMQAWAPLHAKPMQWMLVLRLWLPPYMLGLIAVALVANSRRSHRDTVRLADLSAQLANARLATLSAQLHPHFLFNSLHAISELVTANPPQAVEMVARLGDFLRIAIDSTKKPWSTVETELLGVEAYLAIQRSRFRDRLFVSVKAEPQALTALLPALLLQPLVENAIEHGLSDPDETLEVTVAVARTENRLIVIVTNSTPRMHEALTPSLFGTGLKNVGARLEAAYSGDARINIGPDLAGGTRAELSLPIAVKEGGTVKECSN